MGKLSRREFIKTMIVGSTGVLASASKLGVLRALEGVPVPEAKRGQEKEQSYNVVEASLMLDFPNATITRSIDYTNPLVEIGPRDRVFILKTPKGPPHSVVAVERNGYLQGIGEGIIGYVGGILDISRKEGVIYMTPVKDSAPRVRYVPLSGYDSQPTVPKTSEVLKMGPSELPGLNVEIDFSLAPQYVEAVLSETGEIILRKPEQYPLAKGASVDPEYNLAAEKRKWEALSQKIVKARAVVLPVHVWTKEGVKEMKPTASSRVHVLDWYNEDALLSMGVTEDWDTIRQKHPELIIRFSDDVIGLRIVRGNQVVLLVRAGLSSNQISYKMMLIEAICAQTNLTPYQAENLIYPTKK